MNRSKYHLAWMAAALGLLANCSLHASTITCFAAASLTDSLKEIGAAYEKQTGSKVLFNFAASSLLARQIEEGTPADVFFSADEAKMDGLEKKGLLLKGTRTSRLSNSLVIVVAVEKGAAIETPADLASEKIKRLAIAEPRTVPAGIYAKAYLQKKNLWNELERKIVPAQNVRAALAVVEAGNAEAGIVFKTDAAISKNVKIAYQVPHADSPAISYSVAVLKDSGEPDAAKRFLEYLNSEEASRVFAKYGFILKPSAL